MLINCKGLVYKGNQSDYFPFGMLLPNRNESGDEYRYAFNGMEKDDEVAGDANSYDFGARLYNPRVGRWLSGDNCEKLYPNTSTYASFGNNPILFCDPTGEILKDPYGNIIVTLSGTGGTNTEYYTDESGTYKVQTEFVSGYAYTDEGVKFRIDIPINVTKIERLTEGTTSSYEEVTDPEVIDEISENVQSNCHGLSRLNGAAWTSGYDPQGESIKGLVDRKTGKIGLDGYEKVGLNEAEKVIFFNEDWGITHEISKKADGTWTAKDRNGDIITGTFEEAAGRFYG